MNKLIGILAGSLAGIVVIALAAFLSGTIVWLIWPVVVPAAFPGLVTAGTLAAALTWWQSVLLTWLFAILLKTTVTNNNSSN